MPSFGEFLFGNPQQVQQVPRFAPEQQQALSQILEQLGPALQQANFKGIEQEARRGFNEQTIPTIMERITSLGGGRSSAVGQQLGAAGADFESKLGALRGQYNQQHLQTLLGAGLQPQFENAILGREPGFLENTGSALGSGFGYGLGSAAAGGLGSLAGGAGNLLRKLIELLSSGSQT